MVFAVGVNKFHILLVGKQQFALHRTVFTNDFGQFARVDAVDCRNFVLLQPVAETLLGVPMAVLKRIIGNNQATDMWPGPYGDGGSRKYLMASLDQSLKRLKLDYVDIFYSHRYDPDTPLEETINALSDTVKQGKALYVGISKYPVDKAVEAYAMLKANGTPCLIHQDRYSMKWLQMVAIWAIPLAYLTSFSGWIVAEVGRQPWAIQDLLPTFAAVSDIPVGSIQTTFAIFAIIFIVLFVAIVSIMVNEIRKGPEHIQ